eukprot:42608-Prymnesium_polylepis.1
MCPKVETVRLSAKRYSQYADKTRFHLALFPSRRPASKKGGKRVSLLSCAGSFMLRSYNYLAGLCKDSEQLHFLIGQLQKTLQPAIDEPVPKCGIVVVLGIQNFPTKLRTCALEAALDTADKRLGLTAVHCCRKLLICGME